jgi:hypothetical protein
MIFVIPLVLGAAILALRGAKRDARVAGAQGRWFLAWAAAGAALTFSFLTGLSIGLFVLPFAGLLSGGSRDGRGISWTRPASSRGSASCSSSWLS